MWLRQTLSSTGKARSEIDALLVDVESGEFQDQLRRLRRDAFALLDDRNVVVHSLAMRDHGEAGAEFWNFWHYRSDREARIEPSQLLEHAHDLATITRRAMSVLGLADQWGIAQQGTGGEADR